MAKASDNKDKTPEDDGFYLSKTCVKKMQAYEKAMMSLHDPRYGEQLKSIIKKHNDQVKD